MELTPKMYEMLEAKGKALMIGVDQMVELFFGEGYVPVLILAKGGNPESIMILTKFDTKAELMAILRSAANRVDTGEMMETHNAPKEH